MAETRLYKSRPKLLMHVATGLLLAALCPLIAIKGEGRTETRYIIGAVGAILFGAGAAFAARDFVTMVPRLVLDDRGVSGPGLEAMRFIPWTAIDSVSLSDRRKTGVLVAIDESRLRPEEREAMGIRKPMHDRRGYLVAQIKVADLAIGAEALARMIAGGAKASEAPG